MASNRPKVVGRGTWISDHSGYCHRWAGPNVHHRPGIWFDVLFRFSRRASL